MSRGRSQRALAVSKAWDAARILIEGHRAMDNATRLDAWKERYRVFRCVEDARRAARVTRPKSA